MSIIKAIVNFFKRIFGLAEKHVDETVSDVKTEAAVIKTKVEGGVATVTKKVEEVKAKI